MNEEQRNRDEEAAKKVLVKNFPSSQYDGWESKVAFHGIMLGIEHCRESDAYFNRYLDKSQECDRLREQLRVAVEAINNAAKSLFKGDLPVTDRFAHGTRAEKMDQAQIEAHGILSSALQKIEAMKGGPSA